MLSLVAPKRQEVRRFFALPAGDRQELPGPAGKTTVINQAAFEPDALSLALVEGVRIAQKDLEEAGGANDLDQVRTLIQGVSRQAGRQAGQ
ncbi:hypothetical protein EV128_12088 [Rhizobium azibense]|nr:hypothetical protein EV128_12088 [Rhizobium azibense]